MPSDSRHVSEHIDRSAEDVYAFASDPENLTAWAAGLGPGDRVAFAPRNEFGVLDHIVTTPSGETVAVPMRVTPDGDGAEVVFTVRRLPGMTDADLHRDVGLVAADLATLKRLVESGAARPPTGGSSAGS
jgi:hypothetical protein